MTWQSPLILVVGMHRSGTSLLASLLPPLGVAVPGPLIGADYHNPEGYYEHAEITDLQEQLLIDLGRWWPSAHGMDPLPHDWLNHPACRAASDQLKHLLSRQRAQCPGPWAIKDPRTSLLLPLWRQVSRELELPLRLVLSVRDPAEVMVSLLQRDAMSAGMTANRAQQLWWHHNRRLLLDAGNLPLLTLHYNDWFEPHRCRRQLQNLAHFCLGQGASPAQLSTASGLIRPGHRRSRRNRRELPQPIHPWLIDLNRQLSRLAARGTPAHQCRRLQQWLTPAERNLPPEPAPGPWFDRTHYRRQQPPLPRWVPLVLHYQLLGWRRSRSPHPLFEANHYRHQVHQRGLHLSEPPLCHFLHHGLQAGIAPTSLANSAWAGSSATRQALFEAASLEGLHPWGSAALAVCNGHMPAAIEQLRHWLHHGLTSSDLTAIAAADQRHFSGDALAAPAAPALPKRAQIWSPSCDPTHWELHAWIQHLPLPPGFEISADNSAPKVHLLLGCIPQGPASHLLISLAGQEWIFTTEASHLPLLQRLGINAQLLKRQPRGNGWLERPSDEAQVCRLLGLPTPRSLSRGASVLCLGSAGQAWEQQLQPPIWCWPGFDEVVISSPEQARLLASWLNTCNQTGLQLVRLTADASELQSPGWRALIGPLHPPVGWLPPQQFHAPLHPDELLAELNWQAVGCPAEPPVSTPRPGHTVLWEHQDGIASAAVCISLYNYAAEILRALESVRRQQLATLELIVVDDHSSDDGPEFVRQWLVQHGHRFRRALLVRHHSNAGLAAARNTAFALAKAPWCFVLDADNELEPDAVGQCLALAQDAPDDIAVVHPLVELIENGESRGLIGVQSWQRAQFSERNAVDAMALVRRSAWQRVGGYDHIPGGWEDYDFWCKLLEADLGGVLCPQRLAKYHSHPRSMLSSTTHRQLRRVSRMLQQRHPWLRLHLAQTGGG